MTRIKDIALETGLSTATISRALNNSGYVSLENKTKIFKACKKLNYKIPENVENDQFSRLNKKLIGIVVPDITIPYYATIINQIERYILNKGCILVVSCTNGNSEQELKVLNEYYDQHIAGMIIVPSYGFMKYNYERLIDLKKGGTSIILFERGKDIPELQAFDGVFLDEYASTYMATKHLINRGHKYIALVVDSSGITGQSERFKGYINALEEHNLTFSEDYIIYGGTIGHNYVQTSYNNTKNLLESHSEITSAVSTNNLMTVGVIQAMNQFKSASRRLSVVSFDFGYLEQFYPGQITIINRPIHDICTELIRLLFERMDSSNNIGRKSAPQRLVLKPSLRPKTSLSTLDL